MSQRNVCYSVEEIMNILPHRYPFLLIDKAIEIREGDDPIKRDGRKVVAIKNVTINEPFFEGHFPHRRVMPGVLQIEAMAQASALAAYRPESDDTADVAIVSVSNAKFRHPVVPGDCLEIHAEIVKDRGSMILVASSIFVDGKKVSECELMARFVPMSSKK